VLRRPIEITALIRHDTESCQEPWFWTLRCFRA